MKQLRISIIFLQALLLCLGPVSAYAYNAGNATENTPWYGVSSGSSVNIRTSPDSSSSSNIIVGEALNNGQAIEIVGVPNNLWYKVRYTYNGDTAYVSAQYLTVLSANYGIVIAASGCQLKSVANGGYTVLTASLGSRMPYSDSKTISQQIWLKCAYAKWSGWVNTYCNYDFKTYDFLNDLSLR